MNSQSKAYSIILYLIWPFSALLIGLKNFDSPFGKNLVIALYAFLGFTAVSIGDLERYESEFYENKTTAIGQIFLELISLQTGKFYNGVLSFLSSLVFESHYYYFLILFLVYGFFYIKTVHNLKYINRNLLNRFGLMFFFGLLLNMLVRPVLNLAFYTGGVYILFLTVSYYRSNNIKYLLLFLLAPLFHFGLIIYLIIPPLLLLFKKRTNYYFIFVVLTFILGKSTFVGVIENIAGSNTDTIIESKYNSYASEAGQEALEERYAENGLGNNIKLDSLFFLQNSIWHFFVPFGMVLLIYNRNYFLINEQLRRLFNMVLLFWGISNIMLNISQGERFLVLFSFLAIALFFVVYISTVNLKTNKLFNKFLYVFVPVLFLFGLMTLYACKSITPVNFFISNFPIEIFNYL